MLVAFVTRRFQCRDFLPDDKFSAELADIKSVLSWQDAKPRTHYLLALTDHRNGEIVGSAGILINRASGGKASLTIHLSKTVRGQYAVAFEIGYSLINWAFDALSLTQLNVAVEASEINQQRLLKYAGFRQTLETNQWSLSYSDWTEQANKIWKHHGSQNH